MQLVGDLLFMAQVEAGKLGKLQVVNGSEVLLGPPFIYSKENIDEFDF